ncbi:major facilitator superfamily domain-containing protein [Aspergillus unguis]
MNEKRESKFAEDCINDASIPSDKAIRRRIDWRILPIMFLAYFLQFLDKVCLNYANVMGIQKDLGMAGNDFAWLATAFFIAYSLAEIPQGYLLQKYSVTNVVGCNVFLWGVMLCCSAAAQNYGGLLALRILLGVAEAVIAPGLTIYTSMWYTRRESTPRFGLWYCGLGVGQILGGVISFGAQHASPSLGFAGWRIMFLVIGLVNILAALLVVFLLPGSPETATFLSQAEKDHISARLKADSAGPGPKVFTKAAILTTVADVQTWLICIIGILSAIPSGLIIAFSSIVIKNFGYTSKESALLNTPAGAVSIISILLSTYAVHKRWPRWLTMNFLFAVTLLGACLMSFLPETNQAGLLAGIYIVNATTAPLILVFSYTGTNFKGYTGKVVACGFISAGFGIANIIGPQTFQARDAPDYYPAKFTLVAVSIAAIILSTVLRFIYGARNKKADRLGVSARSWMEARIAKGEDREEDPGFRYVY